MGVQRWKHQCLARLDEAHASIGRRSRRRKATGLTLLASRDYLRKNLERKTNSSDERGLEGYLEGFVEGYGVNLV